MSTDRINSRCPYLIHTKFLNRDAIISMVHFGKGVLEKKEKVKVNTVLDPILVKYYKKGAWDVY